jgi:hypothetical protein
MMTRQRICRTKAPAALVGDLGPMFCSREVTRQGIHAGDHRAHRTVPGLGRLNVLWKQDRHGGPPVIELPVRESTELYHLRSAP